MLNSWIKNNYKNKWHNRILEEKKEIEEEHLWLKSEYNPIWQKIDLPRIFSTMSEALKGSFPMLNDDTRLRTSLRRTRNLQDWINAYNKSVLSVGERTIREGLSKRIRPLTRYGKLVHRGYYQRVTTSEKISSAC